MLFKVVLGFGLETPLPLSDRQAGSHLHQMRVTEYNLQRGRCRCLIDRNGGPSSASDEGLVVSNCLVWSMTCFLVLCLSITFSEVGAAVS